MQPNCRDPGTAAGRRFQERVLYNVLDVTHLVNSPPLPSRCPHAAANTKGYSSTYLAMGFANVRAGTWYPPEH